MLIQGHWLILQDAKYTLNLTEIVVMVTEDCKASNSV